MRRGSHRRDSSQQPGHDPKKADLTKDLEHNLAMLKETVYPGDDLNFRRFSIRGQETISAALVFIDGMADPAAVDARVLRPLLHSEPWHTEHLTHRNIVTASRETLITAGDITEEDSIHDLALAVLSGRAVLLFEGAPKALVLDLKGWEHRGVQQPEAQSIIRGPRDGFTEGFRINTVLVRRRISDTNLRFEWRKVGRRSQTNLAIAYISDIANPEIVEQVRQRIDSIDIDAVLESGYVEQMIEDNWWTVFPTVQETERPDQVAGGMLDGRVAIFVDNTPFVLLVPATIPMFLSSPEDMYFRWPISTLLRMLRYAVAFGSMIVPSLYVALTSFHVGMIPTSLALSVGASREAVPFPAFAEALIMEVILEVLREAGLRLPGPIGQTVGIVGAIIIGEAAVQAGLVSPIMVVAVAATAISSFVIPTYSFAISLRILRFCLLLLAALFGLYGVVLGILAIMGHLATLKSFTVPYVAPMAPARIGDWRDTWFRVPWISMHKRPGFLRPVDDERLDDDLIEDTPYKERQ